MFQQGVMMVRKMIQVGAVPDGEDDNLEGYAAGDCDDDALNTGLELHCYTKHGRHTAATRATTDDGGATTTALQPQPQASA